MKLKITIYFVLMLSIFFYAYGQNPSSDTNQKPDYMAASIALLEALKNNLDPLPARTILEASTLKGLTQQLRTDAQRYAFWINVYNAYIQIHLKANPEYYEDRSAFFKKPLIKMAGVEMSFADIEHGIIRGGQFEYFLGYIRNPFVANYKKKLRPQKLDYRLHFALNCGAKSCPPVAIYKSATLDSQLDKSARLFLDKFSTYDEDKNEVLTTALFSWFRGDFNGKSGVKRILVAYDIVPSQEVDLRFDKYDWTLLLDNYIKG